MREPPYLFPIPTKLAEAISTIPLPNGFYQSALTEKGRIEIDASLTHAPLTRANVGEKQYVTSVE